MARPPDPSRKPALLEQIIEHLLDKELSSLSFRTLATALGVSTYTLVYQFGTRAELIRDLVAAISARAHIIERRLDGDATLETYVEGLELSWQWALKPRNRQLQRLEFEAALLESLDPQQHTYVRSLFEHWQRIGRDALVQFGVPPAAAEVETRLIVDTFHGLQYDVILNGDEAGATAAFEYAVVQHRARIERLIVEAREPAAT